MSNHHGNNEDYDRQRAAYPYNHGHGMPPMAGLAEAAVAAAAARGAGGYNYYDPYRRPPPPYHHVGSSSTGATSPYAAAAASSSPQGLYPHTPYNYGGHHGQQHYAYGGYGGYGASPRDYNNTMHPNPSPPKRDPSTPGSQQSNASPAVKSEDGEGEEKAGNEEEGEDSSASEEEEGNEQKWFSGAVDLGLEDDKYWLSELQVYLRANFAEAFAATEDDIAAPMHGRNKPISFGQVGIRCKYAKHLPPHERSQQAVSYPSLISGIYNSVQQMLRLHFDCCGAIPPDVRGKISQLRASNSSRGGRKQYWIDSAKRLGMVDTPHGIYFARDPHGPLPALVGPSVNSREGKKLKSAQESNDTDGNHHNGEAYDPGMAHQLDDTPARPLVFEEDKQLISDYLYLIFEQMVPCTLTQADRVGCYKNREVGAPGLACKWAVGQAGSGRYFPASEASLSQTTTSQTIANFVRNCRRVPEDIRENLEMMKRARLGPDGKRADKPKHGGRKVFFRRLWCRLTNVPVDEDKTEDKSLGKPQKEDAGKAKKKSGNSDDGDSGNETEKVGNAKKKSGSGSGDSGDETEEEEDRGTDEGGEKKAKDTKKKSGDAEEGEDSSSSESGDETEEEEEDGASAGNSRKEGTEDTASARGSNGLEEEEQAGAGVESLIKAAAIWLKEQDAVEGSADNSRKSGARRGRGLPTRGGSDSGGRSKRRRVQR